MVSLRSKNKKHYSINNKRVELPKTAIQEIEILHDSYHFAKMKIHEQENGLSRYTNSFMNNCKKIVYRIEQACDNLPPKQKIIIEHEVLNHEKGSKWYLEFFSAPTYYVYKKSAYRLFLDYTNK